MCNSITADTMMIGKDPTNRTPTTGFGSVVTEEDPYNLPASHEGVNGEVWAAF